MPATGNPFSHFHPCGTPTYQHMHSPVSVLDSRVVEKEFTVHLWRTGEEILPFILLVDGLLLMQSGALHFVSHVYPSTWPLCERDPSVAHSGLLFVSVCSGSMCFRGSKIK